MSNEDFKNIETFLAANPGAIAEEIGVSPVVMNRLEKENKVVRIGKRSLGRRGRPPVEWALPNSEVTEPVVLANFPKLVDATKAREFANADEARILAYVEKVFDGHKMVLDPRSPIYGTWVEGIREGSEGEKDYKLLAARYRSVVSGITRRHLRGQVVELGEDI